MSAAQPEAERDSSATPVYRLRGERFDELAARHGASSETERARLVNVDRATLYRLRSGKFSPRMDTARRIAKLLDTTVEDLFAEVP